MPVCSAIISVILTLVLLRVSLHCILYSRATAPATPPTISSTARTVFLISDSILSSCSTIFFCWSRQFFTSSSIFSESENCFLSSVGISARSRVKVGLGLWGQRLGQGVEAQQTFLASVEIQIALCLQPAQFLQHLAFAAGQGIEVLPAEGAHFGCGLEGGQTGCGLAEELEDVGDGDGVVALVGLELAEAAEGGAGGAVGVEADAGEGLLGVGGEGAGGVGAVRIHKRIIQNITYMTSKKEGGEEKEKTRTAKNDLAKMVYEAKKKILQGSLTEAHDELYAFITKEKDKLGGDDSVLLLPGLLTIAEIHIIEGRVKKAEQYLNAAHWSFLKSNDRAVAEKKKQKVLVKVCREQLDYKINLHRTFAKLYQLKSDFKEAIAELKTSIYLQSTKWGPEHPYVAHNYFLMGKVFIDMGSQSIGESFFGKVAEIWYRYLKNFFQKMPEEHEAFLVQQFTLEEALNYLSYIQKHFDQAYQEQQSAIVFTPVMRTYYSIGLLFKIFNDDQQCVDYLKEVYRRCLKHLPEHDRKTAQIRLQLQSMNVDLEEPLQPLHQGESKKDDDSLIQLGEADD